MNRQKWILLTIALALIGGTAGLLAQLRIHQKLGAPGVKTLPLADSSCLKVDLPERVLNFESEWVEVDELTRSTLPADTSFGQRRYKASDGFLITMNAVLMGADRTSLHKPQFCLTGQGWQIDDMASAETIVRVEQPYVYDLPVVKLIANKLVTLDGQPQTVRGLYVYWFVADDALSASVTGLDRMWGMASHLLRTGVLQRWAYISCFSVCLPGAEEATFERMKKFIAAATPQFQLTPRPPQVAQASPSVSQ
ncbi:MAG TPA: exosortase-associated EpsI family protein [Clostridia bacterium]|nr:exosortase-associated EpsI family protein [Clostridia bacterium]